MRAFRSRSALVHAASANSGPASPDRRGVPQQAHGAITKALIVMFKRRGVAAELGEISLALDVHAAAFRLGALVIESGNSAASSVQRVAVQDRCGVEGVGVDRSASACSRRMRTPLSSF